MKEEAEIVLWRLSKVVKGWGGVSPGWGLCVSPESRALKGSSPCPGLSVPLCLKFPSNDDSHTEDFAYFHPQIHVKRHGIVRLEKTFN